jgi:anti-sigma factor (TIGR02949 family)
MSQAFDCKQIFAALSDYLDKELPEADCEEMRRHIEDCAPCVQFVKSLERSIDLCRHTQPDAPVAPLSEQMRKRLLEAYRAAISAKQPSS